MTTVLEVHVGSEPVFAGVAYLTVKRGQVTTRFDYDGGFLTDPRSFDLSPQLRRRDRGATAAGLGGVFADSAPDRWGRNLIERRIRADARAAGRTTPTVTEVDYLCGVSDLTRHGALRFRPRGGDGSVAPGVAVPPLMQLPALLAAAREVAAGTDDLAAVKALLAAGTGSLGGARPKASVRDGDRLAIAKFPHHSDTWDVIAWEATALDLAERCGITTPTRRLEHLGDASVLIVDRFDRNGLHRIPYISAMTLLDRIDGQHGDYLELAETFAAHGTAVARDLRELWQRVAFSVAVNNTDDHLRNHGFLHATGGWTLAPLFDVNPNPDPAAHRATSMYGATDRAATLHALIDAAPSFGLTTSDAHHTWDTIRRTVTTSWRSIAAANGVPLAQQHLLADMFDTTPAR